MITHVGSVIESGNGSDQLDDLFLNQLQQTGTCFIPILWYRQWPSQVAVKDAEQYADYLARILACNIVTAVVWSHLVVHVVS